MAPKRCCACCCIITHLGVLACFLRYCCAADSTNMQNRPLKQTLGPRQGLEGDTGGAHVMHPWPVGIDCYARAQQARSTSCHTMSDEDRAHLSYDMTRCYVTKTMAGADLPRCPGSNSVEACMADVDEQMYTLYTLFYSNIDATCAYVTSYLKQQPDTTASVPINMEPMDQVSSVKLCKGQKCNLRGSLQ